MTNSVDPLVNWNLSSVRTSRVPSDLERTYLSSSNGKNTWSVPAVIVFVELSVIVTPNSVLIISEEFERSTDSIFTFGRGANNLSLF